MLWKKKDIYVNRVKSIIFGMIKCILQTRTQVLKCKNEVKQTEKAH